MRRFTHAAVDLFFVKAHVGRAVGNILIDGFFKKLIFRILEHQSHLKTHLTDLLRLGPDVLPVQIDMAGGGLQQAVEMLDQRGLAGAGMSDDAHKFSGHHRQVHMLHRIALKRRTGAVGVGQIFHS